VRVTRRWRKEQIVERETGLIKRKGLALVRGSGGDYPSEAHIFKVGTWTGKYVRFSVKGTQRHSYLLFAGVGRADPW